MSGEVRFTPRLSHARGVESRDCGALNSDRRGGVTRDSRQRPGTAAEALRQRRRHRPVSRTNYYLAPYEKCAVEGVRPPMDQQLGSRRQDRWAIGWVDGTGGITADAPIRRPGDHPRRVSNGAGTGKVPKCGDSRPNPPRKFFRLLDFSAARQTRSTAGNGPFA